VPHALILGALLCNSCTRRKEWGLWCSLRPLCCEQGLSWTFPHRAAGRPATHPILPTKPFPSGTSQTQSGSARTLLCGYDPSQLTLARSPGAECLVLLVHCVQSTSNEPPLCPCKRRLYLWPHSVRCPALGVMGSACRGTSGSPASAAPRPSSALASTSGPGGQPHSWLSANDTPHSLAPTGRICGSRLSTSTALCLLATQQSPKWRGALGLPLPSVHSLGVSDSSHVKIGVEGAPLRSLPCLACLAPGTFLCWVLVIWLCGAAAAQYWVPGLYHIRRSSGHAWKCSSHAAGAPVLTSVPLPPQQHRLVSPHSNT